MPLGRILPWPSGTVSVQPAGAARTRPSLARLGLGLRSMRGPRHGIAWTGVSLRAAAWHACPAATTSPAHGRRCGERHSEASPARGRRHGASLRYRQWRAAGTVARVQDGGAAKAMAPQLTGIVGDGGVRTMRRGRRRDMSDGSCRSVSVAWHVGHTWSGADSGAASDSGGRQRVRTAAVSERRCRPTPLWHGRSASAASGSHAERAR
jgi:hypothetical protein